MYNEELIMRIVVVGSLCLSPPKNKEIKVMKGL